MLPRFKDTSDVFWPTKIAIKQVVKGKKKPKRVKKKSTSALGYGLKTTSRDHQATPKNLYDALDQEFHFDFDPCPLHGEEKFDGLQVDW